MANDAARAEFWKAFVIARSGYPAPDRLCAQLSNAEFSDFCDCGCNSFAVKVAAGVAPLIPSDGGYGSIYTADFRLHDGRTLELILFGDATGNLAYIEVDCCANSYPVPEIIDADEEPFQTWATKQLLV